MAKILVVHGAGMNMRGKVQTEVFGTMTLPEYDEQIRKYAAELGIDIEIFHSNIEGEVINKFYQAHEDGVDAALINPAAYTSGLRLSPRPSRRSGFRRLKCTSPIRRDGEVSRISPR